MNTPMEHNHNNTLQETLLAKIKEGQVVMRPRWHFVLKAVLGILGIIILGMAALYLISFILFALREAGLLFIPGFGFHGMGVFLFSLPWVLILMSAAFIFFLELLVKRYAFGYRKPLLYSVFGVLGLVVLGSALLFRLGFHEQVFKFVERQGMPVMDPFYRGYALPRGDGVHRGSISAFTEKGLMLTTRRGDVFEVNIASETEFPYGLDLQLDDEIVVLGERASSTIEAVGIRRIDDRTRPPMRGMMWGRRGQEAK